MKLNSNLISVITNYVGFYKDLDFEVPFYEKHIKKINWLYLFGNEYIPEKFVEKYIHKAKNDYTGNMQDDLCYKCEDFLDKYVYDVGFEGNGKKLNWSRICENPNFSEKFFKKLISTTKNKVDWVWLSQNTNMSESFYEKYINKIDWFYICENKNLSDKFCKKYINIFSSKNLNSLYENENLSDDFFEEYVSYPGVNKKIDWNRLCKNKELYLEFF